MKSVKANHFYLMYLTYINITHLTQNKQTCTHSFLDITAVFELFPDPFRLLHDFRLYVTNNNVNVHVQTYCMLIDHHNYHNKKYFTNKPDNRKQVIFVNFLKMKMIYSNIFRPLIISY